MTSSLISPDELNALIKSGTPLRILDVRWALTKPDGLDEYYAGHIPGAVYVDLDHDLAAHGLPATEGRHPLPSADELQRTARRLGISDGDVVVAYDGWNNMGAARAWWLLGHAGVADVRVLNGGVRAWSDAGYVLEDGANVPDEGNVTLAGAVRGVLDADEAAGLPGDGVLIDARAPERFRGETEPIDPRAGHIPGAINIPAGSLLDRGHFRPADELRAVFAANGVDGSRPVGAYCGSGVTAAHTALALSEIGIDADVYPGSWSQWSHLPDRPVATGA